ncbi:UNVERIFIED_ORG: catechol 2,3-dioxygenase-like lactoylglutathione lyase family enzyme [Arthrobacter sp. UYEF10]
MRLKMCSIHVQDPAAAHTFYTGTLGFETLMAMPEYNLFIIEDPGADAGSVGLLLEPSDNPIGANYMNALHEAGIAAITFGVPDVQAEYSRLLAAGVTFKGEP